mmetsp:Transcript_44535/g.69674  ORF Transcript_44535/g.69674 Transcript_44535/m.69674 type:complete len:80 (+) Transcript_44535:976-1215(+)
MDGFEELRSQGAKSAVCRHVPYQHAEALIETLKETAKVEVSLFSVPKGNHFLSSNSALNKALQAITAFLIRQGSKAVVK